MLPEDEIVLLEPACPALAAFVVDEATVDGEGSTCVCTGEVMLASCG